MSTLKDPSVYIQDITKWLQLEGGFIHPAVEIVHCDDTTGYSLRVRKHHDVPEGSRIASCPSSLTMSVLSMERAKNLWPEEFVSFFSQCPEVLTRFFLMEQFLMAETSFWHPYVRMLPQPADDSLDTPMFYNAEDCIWIKGTNLEGARKLRQEQWKQEYQKAVDLLEYNDVARYELLRENWRELYLWAATILTSRCFSSNAFAVDKTDPNAEFKVGIEHQRLPLASPSSAIFPVLLPVLDFGNHDPSAGVYWKMQGSSYSFIVNETLESGKEVCISYDDKGNEERKSSTTRKLKPVTLTKTHKVIMGYGFSLDNNTKDAFRLLLRSTSSSQGLAKARSMQQELQEQKMPPRHVASAPYAPDESLISKHTTSEACTVTRPILSGWSPDMFFLWPADNTSFYTANQALVDTFSILVANDRELRSLQVSPSRFWIPSPSTSLTHNRLKLTCSLLAELQRKHTDITTHSPSLPPYPANNRQFHAARYRRSQLHILETNIHSLKTILQAANSPTTRLVRLEDILAKPTPPQPNHLRAAVHQIFGTRQPRKIHELEHEDLVFTLWLCSEWLLRAQPCPPATSFQALVHRWLRSLETSYGAPPSAQHSPVAHASPAGGSTGGDDDDDDDAQREDAIIAASYLAVVKVVAEAAPASVFADERWSTEFLEWGVRIVQEEGLVLPSGAGEEGQTEDEFAVFVGEW
ncbi:hypothetical protein MMC18_003972 [Xylographa bjoerkii]|nr:hypothetical protein [Xylographa bjoerkii]